MRWWAVGGTLPLNCGGAPKLLLAYQSPAEINRVLARPLTQLTPKSVMDPRVLRRQIDKIRERGWEFAVDDVAVGLSALAVPVLDGDGTIVCALSMGGLTPQMARRGQPLHLGGCRLPPKRCARASSSFVCFAMDEFEAVDGVTGRPSKPLARYGAVWWRARSRLALEGGRPSN